MLLFLIGWPLSKLFQKSKHCLSLPSTGSFGQIYAFVTLQNSLNNNEKNTDLRCIAICTFIQRTRTLGGSSACERDYQMKVGLVSEAVVWEYKEHPMRGHKLGEPSQDALRLWASVFRAESSSQSTFSRLPYRRAKGENALQSWYFIFIDN